MLLPRQTPTHPPSPPGQVPNLGPTIIGVSYGICGVSTVIIALRFFARWRTGKKLWWDDWLCIPALLSVYALAAEIIVAGKFDLGKHVWDTNKGDAWKTLEIGFMAALTIAVMHWTIKIAFCLLYIRLFTLTYRWFKIAIFTLMTYTTLWFMSIILVNTLACKPISYFWNRLKMEGPRAQGHCGFPIGVASSTISMLSTANDVFILIIPLVMVGRSKMEAKKKVAILSLFGVGLLACVASVIRVVYRFQALKLDADVTWISAKSYLWTMVEPAVALICVCFPCYWPLFRQWHGGVADSGPKPLEINAGPNINRAAVESIGGGPAVERPPSFWQRSNRRMGLFDTGLSSTGDSAFMTSQQGTDIERETVIEVGIEQNNGMSVKEGSLQEKEVSRSGSAALSSSKSESDIV